MSVRVITGDCREVLRTMPDASVHCIVSSPPYFGLRDYGTAKWEGGDAGCDHLGPPMRTNAKESSRGTFHGGTTRANEPMGRECAKCGAPWVRETERLSDGARGVSVNAASVKANALHGEAAGRRGPGTTFSNNPKDRVPATRHIGWSPPCSCDAPTVPCTVLDPFFGAGTTGLVADRLGRNAIGIELNPEYAAMAQARIRGDLPMFADVEAA